MTSKSEPVKKRFVRQPAARTMEADTPERHFRYIAAEIARRDGLFLPNYATGEQAIYRDRPLMVRINRDLLANNAPYRAIIQGLVGAIVGEDGIEFSPTTDTETKALLQSLWLQWTRFADLAGRHSFTEMERQIVTELLVVGEILLVKRKGLKLQLVESERIEKVNIDTDGAMTSVVVVDPEGIQGRVVIQAADCIYMSLTDRPSQIRGAGILWSCCDIVSMLAYILRKSARAWGMAANYAIAIEADAAPEWGAALAAKQDTDPTMVDPVTGQVVPNDSQATDPLEGRSVILDDCQLFMGRKGEKISTVNHNGIPNVQLGEHVLTYLRIISSVIGCDAATFVLADYSKTNYSSSRAANIALSKTVARFQNKLTYVLYDRIARFLLGSWGAMGLVKNATALLDSIAWICPKPPIIDAKGEAEANEKELALGLTTHNDLLLARNKSPEAYLQQRKAEIIRAVEVANEIEAATGEEVHWETLCGMPMGKTEAAVVAGDKTPAAPVEEQ